MLLPTATPIVVSLLRKSTRTIYQNVYVQAILLSCPPEKVAENLLNTVSLAGFLYVPLWHNIIYI